MRVALLFPEEPEKGGRGKTGSASKRAAEAAGVSHRRIQEARQVLAYSRDLALAVRDGPMKLDEALEEVKAARKALESSDAMMDRLRTEAPDFADLVTEDRMSLREAIAALDARIEEKQRKEITATQLVANLINSWHPRDADPAEFAARLTENAKRRHWPSVSVPLTRENLRAVAAVVAALENQLDRWEA
jgi:hypothetical protein